MANPHLPAFRRRHNENGTWDSICLRCYRTAATAHNPAWLPMLQSSHVCDPIDLYARMSDLEQIQADSPASIPLCAETDQIPCLELNRSVKA